MELKWNDRRIVSPLDAAVLVNSLDVRVCDCVYLFIQLAKDIQSFTSGGIFFSCFASVFSFANFIVLVYKPVFLHATVSLYRLVVVCVQGVVSYAHIVRWTESGNAALNLRIHKSVRISI